VRVFFQNECYSLAIAPTSIQSRTELLSDERMKKAWPNLVAINTATKWLGSNVNANLTAGRVYVSRHNCAGWHLIESPQLKAG
jgi:hypothetical protein